MKNIKKLEKVLKYEFKKKKLIREALNHPSYSNEEFYERLEFLGDLILDAVVGVYIFKKYPEERESFLTNLKSGYVNSRFLQDVGEKLNIQKYIKYKTSEVPKLDDFIEAIIGAIYLDGGWKNADRFIKKIILNKKIKPLVDYKGLLLNFARKNFDSTAEYILIKETGPDHKKKFQIKAKIVGKRRMGLGKAFTRKEAEMLAAQNFLEKIK